jgi:hypothetical protein
MFPNLKKMERDQIWGSNRQLWNEVWTHVSELHEIRTEKLVRGQSLAAQTSVSSFQALYLRFPTTSQ